MIEQTDPNTIADGLLTSMGDLTWPIIRDNVEEVGLLFPRRGGTMINTVVCGCSSSEL